MKKLLVALALLLTTSTIAPASFRGGSRRVNHAHRVMCYTSCPFFYTHCRNLFIKGRWYKRCRKELLYSCLGNPAGTSCARPCSGLNPCASGQQCDQGQCIIQTPPTDRCRGDLFCPLGRPFCDHGRDRCLQNPPTTTTTLPPAGCPADFPLECQQEGFCCPSGDTCNAAGCCSAQLPVACGGYCCTPGSVCGQGGCTDPCPADRPVACGNPFVCCTAGSVCGRDCNAGTTSTTLPGGGNCNCFCPDGTDCTGGRSCGVDENGIPNPCGCPVNCH
jgi:hypothetical protein